MKIKNAPSELTTATKNYKYDKLGKKLSNQLEAILCHLVGGEKGVNMWGLNE